MIHKLFRRRERSFSSQRVPAKRKRFFRPIRFSPLVLTGILSVIFILLTAYTIFFSGIFTADTVEFSPRQISCATIDEIKTLIPKRKNIFLINTQELGIILKTKFPCINTITISKQLPGSLRVEMGERAVVALLKTGKKPMELQIEDSLIATREATASTLSAQPKLDEDLFSIDENLYTKLFSVDREGFILEENPTPESALPLLYYLGSEELSVNEYVESGLIESALVLLEKAKEHELVVESAKIDGTSFYLKGPTRIVFLLKKGIDDQIIPLQLILQKAKIDSETIEKIDLRFDKPVVVYGKKAKR